MPEGKVLDLPALKAALAPRRAAGETVALANGLFDILHVGHLRYLEAAKEQARILVVGVNGDESASRLKGKGRPIVPEAERAELVAGFACVDYVVIFHETSADALILALRPDVHCKGTDYKPDTVPEREAVASYGGRVAIVGDPKSHATRDILARMSGKNTSRD